MLSEEQRAWIDAEAGKVYRVLVPPPPERVWTLKKGRSILVGDYGWHVPLYSPDDLVGKLIHLNGYGEVVHMGPIGYLEYIWRADFLPTEVEFVTKPDPDTWRNCSTPYRVQKPQA
jgi:hypothetical protein